jgi:hypothetical protein
MEILGGVCKVKNIKDKRFFRHKAIKKEVGVKRPSLKEEPHPIYSVFYAMSTLLPPKTCRP